FFFFQAEDGIRDATVTGVQTCALPIFFLRLDHELAFLARELSEAPVLPALPCAAREDTGRLEDEADEFRDGEPGDAGEETQADEIGRASCRERVRIGEGGVAIQKHEER